MAIFRQSPFQFGHSPLQLLNLFSQGRIFRFQLGYAFFYAHGSILAAHAIPYLSNYQDSTLLDSSAQALRSPKQLPRFFVTAQGLVNRSMRR